MRSPPQLARSLPPLLAAPFLQKVSDHPHPPRGAREIHAGDPVPKRAIDCTDAQPR